MGRKKRTTGDHSKPKEVVAISIQLQIDNFMKDDGETELKFPSSLSKGERAFIHEKAKVLGINSKSSGVGSQRYITIYKRSGSAIIQYDATLDLTSSMRESISSLLTNYPITAKEKEDLLSGCEKDRGLPLARDSLYLSTPPLVPNTHVNPETAKFKRELPVYDYKDRILSSLKSNQVIIIIGETGSGKTTQIPQYIMEQQQMENKPCRIFCTQPRRISAVSVAERVAYERNESVGHSVGYQIRLEAKISSKTSLTYCTSGVLLRILMSGGSVLNNVTHIVVDEVHERDKLLDFLLISLKEVLPKYQDLRIVLMSATIDHDLFSRYFDNCPVLPIPGRLFDVEQYFLDDILEMSGYWSKDMEKVRRQLKLSKPHKLVDEPNDESINASMQNVEDDLKQMTIDADLQADVDEFLNDCYFDGSIDSFGQMMYMYLNENIPVDSKHSLTGITGLMAAAYHKANETVEQMIQMGANPSITDKHGKTAIDYARMKGNDDCAEFLDYVARGIIGSDGEIKSTSENVTENSNELLEMYLDSVTDDAIDYELIVHIVKHVHLTSPKGSILVFISGYEDILSLKALIENCAEMYSKKYQLFTLHSNMQTSDQKRVFARMGDTRKIILATNIAETSITIDDVVYVIDSAKAKEMYFESCSGVCSLRLVWISKACSKQRAGRAGRVQPGKCFTLCSKERFTSLLDTSIPEILRSPIHELCLQTKRLAPTNTTIADYLSKAIEPPVFSAVKNSVSLLKVVGALTNLENLTEMGQLLLELPVEPHLGKMLIYACIFKCLDPILTITSSLSFNEPFQIGSDPDAKRRAYRTRKCFSGESLSDHMAILKSYQEWTEAKMQKRHKVFCEKSFINGATMESISLLRTKFIGELRSTGLIRSKGAIDLKELNTNSDKWHVIKAVIFCGLYPNLARVDRLSNVLRSSKEVRLSINTQSALVPNGKGKDNQNKALKSLPTDWVMYGDMNRVGKVCYIRNNTIITDMTVALLAGPLRLLPDALRAAPLDESDDSDAEDQGFVREVDRDVSYLSVDDWIVFKSKFNDGLAILLLREKFAAMMIRRLINPSKVMASDNVIIDTMFDLLAKDEYKAGLALQTGIWQAQENTNYPKPDMSRQYNDTEYFKTYSNSSYRPGNSPYYVSVPNNGKNLRSNNDRKKLGSPKMPYSPIKNEKNFEMKLTENKKYFLVKAASVKVVEESQRSRKWNFIPGTERHIVNSAKAGNKTILFFSIGGSVQMFLGWAEFVLAAPEGNPPTIYPVNWMSTNHLTHNAARHLINTLDENRRVGGTRDGLEISQESAVTLKHLIDSVN